MHFINAKSEQFNDFDPTCPFLVLFHQTAQLSNKKPGLYLGRAGDARHLSGTVKC